MKGKKKISEEEEKKDAEDTTPTAATVNADHEKSGDDSTKNGHTATLMNGTNLKEETQFSPVEEK